MEEINASVAFDKRLAEQDIAGSLAHAEMLAQQGILSQADAAAIARGLGAIRKEVAGGTFPFRPDYEDVHMNIEARLAELIGEAAGRLHTARSRNDQVATDLRLWLREACARAGAGLTALQRALVAQADTHAATIMPGFTHMQPAQPVTFGHHCLAYVEMLARDRGRFADAARRMNESPLGAAALAGTSFPIDRAPRRRRSASTGRWQNSLDAVSSRDFALEYLAACAIAATHLSRLAEEIVLWASPAYGFIRLSDAFTTGSSIMPQKRNPDAAELVRAKVGRILGAFAGLCHRDEGPAARLCQGFAGGQGAGVRHGRRARSDAGGDGRHGGRHRGRCRGDEARRGPRLSHRHRPRRLAGNETGQTVPRSPRIAGKAVARAEALGVALDKLPLDELKKLEPGITNGVYGVLSLEASVNARLSEGGTAPERVREQVKLWKDRLA